MAPKPNTAMCAWRCSGRNNFDLAMQLKGNGIIKSPEVEAAFLATDRKHFCPKEMAKFAYDDRPIRHGHVHMSAPHMYASSLESLDLREGDKFLCVGSGSGYFCTLVGNIIGPTGINHGIEIFKDVVDFANEKRLSYKFIYDLPGTDNSYSGKKSSPSNDSSSNGGEDGKEGRQELPSENARKILKHIARRQHPCVPQYITGNCFDLQPQHNIRYDRIYVAAGAPNSMCERLGEFLEIGGCLVGPFDDTLLKVTRRSSDSFSKEVKGHVRFAPLLKSLEEKEEEEEEEEDHEAMISSDDEEEKEVKNRNRTGDDERKDEGAHDQKTRCSSEDAETEMMITATITSSSSSSSSSSSYSSSSQQIKRRRLTPPRLKHLNKSHSNHQQQQQRQHQHHLRFVATVWSPRSHCSFPKKFRAAIFGILVHQRRRRDGLISRLPRDTWMYIFRFMNRDWFHKEKTEVELLRDLLEKETRARKEAETRAIAAERERDRAMMCSDQITMQLKEKREYFLDTMQMATIILYMLHAKKC
eukprot:jgi/Bigna1/77931/fgenesh1_pg.51_\